MTAQRARLEFLQVSATSLVDSSPSTAAFLMAERTNIFLESGHSQKPGSEHGYCHVCGNIFIPGKTARIATLRAQTVRKRVKKPRIQVPPSTTIACECFLCGYKTLDHHPKPSKLTAGSKNSSRSTRAQQSISLQAQEAEAPALPTETDADKPISENSSSKRRAKARKKGGLQALLAQNKTSSSVASSSTSGLDLLDFFKN